MNTAAARPEVIENAAPTLSRTGREVPWLWGAYLLVTAAVLVNTALTRYDMANNTPAQSQWAYVLLAAVGMFVAGAVAVLRWRRLPALLTPVPWTVQVLIGLVLGEAAGLVVSELTATVAAVRYSQLPPPVDTSFMGYAIAAYVVLTGLGVLGVLVTLALMRGSRAALVCTVIAQVPVVVVVAAALVSSYSDSYETMPTAPLAMLVLLVPFVLTVLPSTWAWAPRRPQPGTGPARDPRGDM